MTHARISTGKLLREAVEKDTIIIPGAFDALVGRMIEEHGFQACYLSGAAFSASTLALPDVGLFSLTELTQQTARLARSVAIPVIVDADTGFGEAIHVERTVRELEAAGAAAIQLEDQQFPKRCGHLSGKSLIDVKDMCAKIRAAAESKLDKDFVIIARTDARGVTNLADAVSRAQEYVTAGADWIFPEALTSREEFATFAGEVNAPLMANMTEFGKSPLMTVDELAELGYAAALFPVTLMRVAMKGVDAALATLAADGTQQELLDVMQTRQELYELLRYKDFEERDRRHFQGEST